MSDAADVSKCIETVTGRYLDPLDPREDQIDLEDIAWGLSRISRFAGHTTTAIPYNVAQHCIYVSHLMQSWFEGTINLTGDLGNTSRDLRTEFEFRDGTLLFKALIHDAHEAYTGDIPSPIKRVMGPAIRNVEISIDKVLYKKFGLEENSVVEAQLIHYFDKLAQKIEAYRFMPSRGMHWTGLPQPTLVQIQDFPNPETAIKSYELFLQRFKQLQQDIR